MRPSPAPLRGPHSPARLELHHVVMYQVVTHFRGYGAMNAFPAPRLRRAARLAALCAALPLCALAASPAATAPAASQPAPTAGSRIATKCAAMSGDERNACEKDVRHASKAHR